MKKYNILYADPPWKYRDKLRTQGGGSSGHYPTMSPVEIANLPVRRIVADNAVLFLWLTWPFLYDSELVLTGWGFKYKTVAFVWLKTNQRRDPDQGSFFAEDYFDVDDFLGMGTWTRSNTEIVLLATRGKPKRRSKGVRQLIFYPIMEHSRKPDQVRDRIVELCGELPRLELFARTRTPGWDAFGNQVNGSIELPAERGTNGNG
jgi:N6-adenosine-specific RNA methylase IME4